VNAFEELAISPIVIAASDDAKTAGTV